ncbi:CD3324 family protein [Murimonas intestini]|uniref:Mor transcription activator domain-containing protein n=1 Tax=Murimonas intestini TaxID=1337051 RepID=A0AB73SXM1_9FIRM|nr:CD3324 family protein [Murimonas intestini]MCR1843371.1 CD3324 family protein [Murimonas intestini]MCR1868707.1 CD3324 family protein [Murimonas intestini]MCR1886345.1 CD3324 family protein [Murimonas intestini]
MRYLNASEILPDELLREIQKYTQGETLYIPKENERKKWGENSGSRSYYIERNSKILEKYRENGCSMQELADEFNLSVESIRKIIFKSGR